MYFVDTNIFIYYLFLVDINKHEASAKLFLKAQEGTIDLWTTEWVVAEIFWFLRKNKVSLPEVKKFLIDGLINGGQVKVQNGKKLVSIIEKCKKDSDFVDYMNMYIVDSNRIRQGYSYDRALDGWKNFKRLEP